MEPLTTTAIISIVTGLTAGAASYGATKQSLNGTRERAERIESKLDKHIEDSHGARLETNERLTRLETKLEG